MLSNVANILFYKCFKLRTAICGFFYLQFKLRIFLSIKIRFLSFGISMHWLYNLINSFRSFLSFPFIKNKFLKKILASSQCKKEKILGRFSRKEKHKIFKKPFIIIFFSSSQKLKILHSFCRNNFF